MTKKKKKIEAVTEKSPKKPLNVKLLVAVILSSVLSTIIYFGLAELSVAISEKAGEQIYIFPSWRFIQSSRQFSSGRRLL